MTWLIVFLMFCSFGLGVCWNIIWTNMKALDEMVKRHKQEDEMFIAKFKQGLDNITKDHVENQSKNIDKLKASIKK
jgi:hypothetical protein